MAVALPQVEELPQAVKDLPEEQARLPKLQPYLAVAVVEQTRSAIQIKMPTVAMARHHR
jgi:hypothetical protein